MDVLSGELDLAGFFEQLRSAPHTFLLLDYDGTLAPFQADSSKAHPYPGVRRLLDELLCLEHTRLAIVTGRWIKDLLPLLPLLKTPEIWGSHGLERLKADGSYESVPIDETALNGLVMADEWAEAEGFSRRCERKPGCVALHWRGVEEREALDMVKRVGERWQFIAEGWGLELRGFDGGIELRAPAKNKGNAVQAILEEMGEHAWGAYLGDDLTDEDAFHAIKGHGVGVLVRKELRETAADIWLEPPEELLSFLSSWVSAGGRGSQLSVSP